jgi:SAM-dependent MidA family methyltransferase
VSQKPLRKKNSRFLRDLLRVACDDLAMPDPDSNAPRAGASRGQASPIIPPAATHSLCREIPAHGLAFPEFMSRALYDPEHGYYARGAGQVGRGGDFFTSVSVGPLFGHLLARRFLRWWREAECSGRWRIIELGAHDGRLAADVLSSISRLDADAHRALEYVIAEPLEALRVSQETVLADHSRSVRWVNDVSELAADPQPGVAIGNELLDALPFHVVTLCDGRWHESGVVSDPENPDSLAWCDLGPVDGALAQALGSINADKLPEGYRTEVRTNFAALHSAIASSLTHGRVMWIDYGFARQEYYDPARTGGTLRTFSRHLAGEDPLANPGHADITAHVDFTAVAEGAADAGFALATFQSQGAWLTREAREWLMEIEGDPDPAAVRQFQTLTHPAHLGSRFHVIEFVTPGPALATAADFHRCGLT